jgi:enamine deaminase RidA (YjgF/YER057c/UK114 family)
MVARLSSRAGATTMIERLQPGPRMSQAVIHGNTVYLAGQVADDTSADVTGQTRQILASIDRLLAAAGSDRTRILSATVYLADIGTFGQMNAAWDAWVPPGAAPARATVEAKLAAPAYRVEIQVIAARD